MANSGDKNLKFGQNFLIQCILGGFSSFHELVSKFWLNSFGEQIQFIAIIDKRPVNRPIFYGNSEVNQCARLAKISWLNVSLVAFLHFKP